MSSSGKGRALVGLWNTFSTVPLLEVHLKTFQSPKWTIMVKLICHHFRTSMPCEVNCSAQTAICKKGKFAEFNLSSWKSKNHGRVPAQDFHESLHSLLLWLAHADSRRYAVDVAHPDTSVEALQQHRSTLTVGRCCHTFRCKDPFVLLAPL